MMLPVETLAIAVLIVTGAYVAFGLTGFGSTVIALPLLALLVPLKFAVPLMMLLDLAATIAFGARARRGIRFDELAWLVPFMLAGMAIGLTLLISVAENRLLTGLGLFVLAYALYGLLRKGPPVRWSRAWSPPFGLAGGVLTALFGTGGVVFAIYVSGRMQDKEQLRATNASMIMLSSLIRVVLFGVAGLLTQDALPATALLLVPAMLLGCYIGHRLHQAVPAGAVVRAVYLVLMASGATLLVRAWT